MRIAIVNDMLIAVEALRRVVSGAPGHRVAWVARDGAEAVIKCAADTPDLILMDLIMPGVDGAEATRRIMSESPCAILVVTATVSGNAPKVFEAMGFGALDAVNTPVLGAQGKLEGAIALLNKIATIGKLIGKTRPSQALEMPKPERRPGTGTCHPLVAVGASTGGPKALSEILSILPDDFPAAMVVIQHVDVEFAPGLVAWLGNQSRLPVRLAMEGDRPEAGQVVVAGTNDHMILTSRLTLGYTTDPTDYPYRPSADVFFKSATAHWPGRSVGVLLTGMGRDGAEGLLCMRRAGCHTLAQDRETCVVYGMPKAAAELGAAVEILPITKIGPAIVRSLKAPARVSYEFPYDQRK
ncbi:MAG TPA: chemotaxis response regulator protein-glutamate methylesterase [Acidobacteriota bacterium]|jgi:two-component system response regulator WspF